MERNTGMYLQDNLESVRPQNQGYIAQNRDLSFNHSIPDINIAGAFEPELSHYSNDEDLMEGADRNN